MTTFDGAPFVGEQLRSILTQDPAPDEVVVSDDGSSDETLAVVGDAAAAASARGVRVSVLRDQPRAGVVGNVERALAASTADILFFADQDDVWLPGKVRRQVEVMVATGADVSFSDSFLVDGSGVRTGARHWETLRFGPRTRTRFDVDPLGVLLRANPVCGAAMAVRRAAVVPRLLPASRHGLHDQWIALLAVATGAVVVPIEEPLLEYRVHGGNQVGAPTAGVLARLGTRRRDGTKGDERLLFQDARARMATLGCSAEVLARMDAKIAHVSTRASLPPRRVARLVPVARELARGGYRRYSRGLESAAFDLVFRPGSTGPSASWG